VTFTGADWSRGNTGWVDGALTSAIAAAERVHGVCYKIPPAKLFNPNKRLIRSKKKGTSWDGPVHEVKLAGF
jgi:hypothetical protein